MLCGGCGKHRHCVYHPVCAGAVDAGDEGCDVDCVLSGVWGGWHADYLPPDYAAREPGAGAQEARVSVDGE